MVCRLGSSCDGDDDGGGDGISVVAAATASAAKNSIIIYSLQRSPQQRCCGLDKELQVGIVRASISLVALGG